MELGQESPISNLEDVKGDKITETLERIENFDINGKKNNGGMINLSIREDKKDEEANEPIGSPSLEPKSIGSPPNSNLEVNSSPVKGYGLKKWRRRRIRRDLNNKDTSEDIDSLVVLKRQLSNNEPKKARDDNKVNNVVEGEVATATPFVGSFHSVEAVGGVTLDPELAQLVVTGGFSIGMDSDNSDDRGSKSSTATSFPTLRHEIGFGRERTRMKNVGGRGGGHASQQRSQRGRGDGLVTGKKIRGDRIRLEKENSPSSIESDLRSSNMGFLQWGSGVSDSEHCKKSLDFDGENGDETQIGKGARSGYHEENGTVEELLREELDPDLLNGESKGKKENFRHSSGIDPFVESIVMLEAAQEALEREIQKLGEIEKATVLDDFNDQSVVNKVSSSASPGPDLLELTCKMEHLQNKLEEVSAMVRAKESKVIELEDIINRTQLSESRTGGMEFELEGVLTNKIQAEIEFMIINRATHSWKVVAEDRIALFEEKNIRKIREAEDETMKLKDKADELEAYCEELLRNERVLKLKKEVCKISLCSFIQLLLFCVTLGLFLIQLMPPSDEFVPT